VKADIRPQKTPTGRMKPSRYDVSVTGYDKSGLRYLSLSADELDAIMRTWAARHEELLEAAK